MIQMLQALEVEQRNRIWYRNCNQINSKVCFTAFINNKFKLMINNNKWKTNNTRIQNLNRCSQPKLEASTRLILHKIKHRRE